MTQPPSDGFELTPARVAALTFPRLILNVAYRMVYPFLPAIARGLGVSLASASLLVTWRSLAGLVSPLFGPLSDRLDRRWVMVGGLLTLVVGATLVALVPTFLPVALGFLLMGLAKVVFDPNLQAYVGDRVPYPRRGRVIGLMELAWGGAILVGAPAVGWAIDRWGWRSPFVGLVILGMISTVLVLRGLPAEDPRTAVPGRQPALATIGHVLRNRAAVAMLGITLLMVAANALLFLVYGAWMETSFGLSVGRIGIATATVGAAELLGEIGVGGLVDRLGKRRSIAVGLVLTALCYIVLPFVASTLVTALIGMFGLFFCFEFTIVSTMPLATELAPGARGTLMTWNVAAFSLGGALGAALAPRLWALEFTVAGAASPLWANGIAAGCMTLAALGLLLAFVDTK